MRKALLKRLQSYWRLEAANVVLVPAVAAYLILSNDDHLSEPVLLSMVACSALLVVGTLAWRMELAALLGDRGFGARVLPWLWRARPATLALSLLSLGAAAWEVWRDGGWTPSAIGAVALAVLATLEFVNYYVVQLQHFDNLGDVQRLLRGRGFREAHLAAALRRWRRDAA